MAIDLFILFIPLTFMQWMLKLFISQILSFFFSQKSHCTNNEYKTVYAQSNADQNHKFDKHTKFREKVSLLLHTRVCVCVCVFILRLYVNFSSSRERTLCIYCAIVKSPNINCLIGREKWTLQCPSV